MKKSISRLIVIMLSMMLFMTHPVTTQAKAANTYSKYVKQNGVYYNKMPKKYRKGYSIARTEYQQNRSTGYGTSMVEVLGKILYLQDHTSAFTNSSKALSVSASKKTYNKAKRLARSAKGSKYTKALILHDKLMEYVTYDESGKYGGQSAYEALINRKAVCSGIARAYKLMCDIVGIKCYCVYGNAGEGFGSGGAHQWNIIQLDDGEWYEVDVTFDMSFNSHDFFCLSTDEMANVTVDGVPYFHERTGLDQATNLFMRITPTANGVQFSSNQNKVK